MSLTDEGNTIIKVNVELYLTENFPGVGGFPPLEETVGHGLIISYCINL